MEIETDEHQAKKSRLLFLSLLFGLAGSFLLFSLFIQTETLSRLGLASVFILFLLLSGMHYFAADRWLRPRMEPGSQGAKTFVVSLLLAAIFLPLLYRSPSYPVSPLLRPWSEVAVQFQLDPASPPLELSLDDVRLIVGKEAINSNGFQHVGEWVASGRQLDLSGGKTASLDWTGTVPETLVLSIQPLAVDGTLTIFWDGVRTTLPLHSDEQKGTSVSLTRKFSLPWGYDLAFFLCLFVIVAWLLAMLGILFRSSIASLRSFRGGKIFLWGLLLLSIGLSILTVKLQVDSLVGGVQYLSTTQLARHDSVLLGHAPNPWQYRLLSEWVVEGLIRLYQGLTIPRAVVSAFISLRLMQNAAIFLLTYLLYRQLSGARGLALLGVAMLACSMVNAFFDNDLSFNTYFDVIFYLLAALLMLHRRYWAVVIVAVLAALK